jgi:hypothetical protein
MLTTKKEEGRNEGIKPLMIAIVISANLIDI